MTPSFIRPLAIMAPLALACAIPFPAMAKPAPAAEASIAFANHGGVRNWEADGSNAIYFEDSHRQWYRAELMGPAIDLPFAERIAIDSRPNGTLDRFGAVIVRGQRYPFTSFDKVAGPPPRKHTARK